MSHEELGILLIVLFSLLWLFRLASRVSQQPRSKHPKRTFELKFQFEESKTNRNKLSSWSPSFGKLVAYFLDRVCTPFIRFLSRSLALSPSRKSTNLVIRNRLESDDCFNIYAQPPGGSISGSGEASRQRETASAQKLLRDQAQMLCFALQFLLLLLLRVLCVVLYLQTTVVS